ncbi:MAG: DUF2298 domain-containing protein [Candidatus Sumerlaeota bacterium]|nr:DUF2298 domain-containing protein [Candidatus Sumerlaeota bacterium]
MYVFFGLFTWRQESPLLSGADPKGELHALLRLVQLRPWDLASKVSELAIFWGLIWLALLLALTREAARRLRRAPYSQSLGLLISFIVYAIAFLGMASGGLALPICLGLAMGWAAVAWRSTGADAERFAARLAFAGFLIVFVAEAIYIQDRMGEGFQRYNTVFKLYYPAWAELVIAAVFFVWQQQHWLKQARRPGARLALGIGVAGLLALGAVYPCMATWARTDGFLTLEREHPELIDWAARANPAMRTRTLDGLEHLGDPSDTPDDLAAIRWLNENVKDRPHILEAAGPAYSATGRVSAYTGLPTVIGWDNHEAQWRGWDRYWTRIQARQEDVRVMYESQDLYQVFSLIYRYNITYVFVGRLERERYKPEGLEKFARIGREVFHSGQTSVYLLTELQFSDARGRGE